MVGSVHGDGGFAPAVLWAGAFKDSLVLENVVVCLKFFLLHSITPGSHKVTVDARYLVEGRDEAKLQGLNHHFSS